MSKPIITVFGATGPQGGGLVRALLNDTDRHFAVRAVTRRPDSPAARELAAAGADVVLADIDDRASVLRALEGAYGAFLVTHFWGEHFTAAKEQSQALNLAAAAAQAGIRHAIWSTFEDTRTVLPADGVRMPVLEERYNVPHFDAKGEAHRFFAQQRVPVTYLYTSCTWENLGPFGMLPWRDADGSLAMTVPTGAARIPWLAAEDIGRTAREIFLQGESLLFDSIGIAAEHLTGAEMAAQMSAALGELVEVDPISPDDYRALPIAGAKPLGNMWQFQREFAPEFLARRSLERTRALHPGVMGFSCWLTANRTRLVQARAA
jgi:uncharacterized protein YbjT (DUF2867 family)